MWWLIFSCEREQLILRATIVPSEVTSYLISPEAQNGKRTTNYKITIFIDLKLIINVICNVCLDCVLAIANAFDLEGVSSK